MVNTEFPAPSLPSGLLAAVVFFILVLAPKSKGGVGVGTGMGISNFV